MTAESIEQNFTYLFYDLMSGTKIAELPLSSVGYGPVLNGIGALNASLNSADKNVKKALYAFSGEGITEAAGRTAVYVDINGVLDWGGILWTVQPDGATRILKLGAKDFWSYFAQARRIGWDATYTTVDPLAIVEDLINTAQAQPGGDIGVIVPANLCGQLVSAKWTGSQATLIGQAVTSLAQQSGVRGFDYGIDVAYDGSFPPAPQKILTLDYPRRGRLAGETGLVFDNSNAWCKGYTWPTDATAAANAVYGIGAGTGPSSSAGGSIRSNQAFPTAIDAGYPLLEGSFQRTDITDQDTLDALTTSYLASVAYPVSLPTMTFSLDMPDPQYGSWELGDDAEVIIQADEYFPIGYQGYKRIVGWTVNPADSGLSTVTLSFAAPPLEL